MNTEIKGASADFPRLYPRPREAPVILRQGDEVLVRNFGKNAEPFGPTWVDPFVIVKRLGNGTYSVDRNGSQVPVHIDDLRKWQVPDGGEQPEGDPMNRPETGPAEITTTANVTDYDERPVGDSNERDVRVAATTEQVQPPETLVVEAMFHQPAETDIDGVQRVDSVRREGDKTLTAVPTKRVRRVEPDFDRIDVVSESPEISGVASSVRLGERQEGMKCRVIVPCTLYRKR